MVNQAKGLDPVNSFESADEIWMFAPSFYLKQKQ